MRKYEIGSFVHVDGIEGLFKVLTYNDNRTVMDPHRYCVINSYNFALYVSEVSLTQVELNKFEQLIYGFKEEM